MGIRFIILAAWSMVLSILLGAFGAHALSDVLSAKSMEVYRTAVLYQMVHSLGLLFIGYFTKRAETRLLIYSGLCLVLGIVFFSGSLYLLSLTGSLFLGIITPIGGLLFILGWILFAIEISRSARVQ